MTTMVASDRTGRERGRNAQAPLPRFERGPVLAWSAGFLAVELAMAARYGLHRDELYFLACGRHLAWGYVDQPPFVPLVARVASALFGASAVSLRVLPALAGATTVVLAALIARELGGRRRAQTFAALATALSPVIIAATHLLSTAGFDIFFWALLSWLFVRLLRTRDDRLWIAIGAVAGVALLNKWNVLFALGAIALGCLLVPEHRPRLRSPFTLAGGVLALAIWTPNLVWNAQHDWAAIAMLHSLHAENSTLGASISFLPLQLLIVGPALAVFWIAGVRTLRTDRIGRVFAIAFIALLVAYVLTGAKPYYLAGIYPSLLAAGGVWYERRLAPGPADAAARGARRTGVVIVVIALVSLPISLPVLPERTLPTSSWEGNINKDLSATIGWPALVRQVARVADSLPPSERAHLVVFTGDYGAAGAIDEYGARYGLPHAISGHNNYWWWGWGAARNGATTITIELDRSYLSTIFDSITPAGTVATPHNAWSEERGAPIFVCRHQRVSWKTAWPKARHYD
jgi:hypothetical protein